MGLNIARCVALGVLVFVMVPLASAGGPKLLDELGEDDAAEEAQEQAEQQAAQAQQEASWAQEQVSAEAEEAGRLADATSVQATSSFMAVIVGVQAAAEEAFTKVTCFLFGCGSDGSSDGAGYGPRGMSVQSSSIVPVSGDATLAIAMVVAAGAVGGALLWVTVLQRGLIVGLVPLLSRIAHSEIYANDARRLVAQIASENAGLCLNDIVARTGYSRNAVSYHLFVLEKEEELVSVKDGKYRRYFPRGGKYVNGAKQVVSILRNETTLKMAQHIVSNPGSIQREVCRVLGTTASAACWHAKRLEQLGVIRKERVANTVRYFPGDELGRHDYSDFGLVGAPATPLPGI